MNIGPIEWCGRSCPQGLRGMHFHGESDTAIPNGTRVAKCATETSDCLQDGDEGTVISSAYVPESSDDITHFYFVEWDKAPGIACGIGSKRIERLP